MKRWVTRCAAGVCVAGMVAAAPGVAVAESASGSDEVVTWTASENMNVALYGPPSMFEPSEEPIQLLYGPPSTFEPADEPVQLLYGPPAVLEKQINPMTVTAKKSVSVKASRLADGPKRFPKAITVSDAVGEVTFSKIADGSSKRLAVNKSSGVIRVKKGTKKGTYSIQVAVQAAGDDEFAPKSEIVTVRVRVTKGS